ncbi:acyltransferase [Chitinophaga sp. 22321]|uniref:acyltransferase n=1 Tax=Chitinophaga TaxID=79328 RepID=UPI0020122EEC|nr:DapH/DapD/GlmU-related protein [Chitinophaga hostae]
MSGLFLNKIANVVANSFHKAGIKRLKFRQLGTGVSIGRPFHCSGEGNISIGEYVYIGPGAKLYGVGGIHIGKGTIIGPDVTIYSANHVFREANYIPYDQRVEVKPVTISENVWIGGNVIIVPGTNIGEGCIVGAGSVVTGSIAPFSIVAGNPAKVIGSRDAAHYTRLKQEDKIYFRAKQLGTL